MERKAVFWKIVSCILLCALIIGGADRLSIQAESTGNKESEFIEESSLSSKFSIFISPHEESIVHLFKILEIFTSP